MFVREKLRKARREKEMTLQALAAKTGYSAAFLHLVEKNEKSLSVASLCTLANALELNVTALVKQFEKEKIKTLQEEMQDAFENWKKRER